MQSVFCASVLVSLKCVGSKYMMLCFKEGVRSPIPTNAAFLGRELQGLDINQPCKGNHTGHGGDCNPLPGLRGENLMSLPCGRGNGSNSRPRDLLPDARKGSRALALIKQAP